ncbi:MAG: glycolate oxidase subunit GlcF [Gammaproteobacteria bacterium]|nr:glycolate oxidase subunit GlcF [Gammaproteobacteria bacterium]MCP5299429.1 glycolate oxidase subunit GlcF [Chromatiaceae bacterium]
MQIHFSEQQLRQSVYARSNDALTRCLQCAYCLPNCPTYRVLGDEKDSPKGRVALIRDMLERGGVPEADTVRHIDQCLSCLACLSSCPSFVNYMNLVDHARSYIETHYPRPLDDRLTRWALASVLPYPNRFRWTVRAARLLGPLAGMLPRRLGHIVRRLPERLTPATGDLQPQVFPAEGPRRYRVALLAGCVQQALNSEINAATIRILCRHGCEVVVAQGAACCGALTHHMGKTDDSLAAARNNVRAWTRELDGAGLDAIVINTSGCGTVVKDYGQMLDQSDVAADAGRVAAIARDISELLGDLDLEYRIQPDMRVAYHATCSLQFGQRIRYAPRKLLKSAGFTVLEPRDAHVCCGSAATYHLLQPEISTQLKEQKVTALEECQPDAIVAGNIGCMEQIGSATQVPVVHTVQLLDWVTGGPKPPELGE